MDYSPTHYQHDDNPHDQSPMRPGRHCGPQCDLYVPAERAVRVRMIPGEPSMVPAGRARKAAAALRPERRA